MCGIIIDLVLYETTMGLYKIRVAYNTTKQMSYRILLSYRTAPTVEYVGPLYRIYLPCRTMRLLPYTEIIYPV